MPRSSRSSGAAARLDDDRVQERGADVDEPSAEYRPASGDVCGALGCHEAPDYEVRRLEDGERRTLCEDHAERWASR